MSFAERTRKSPTWRASRAGASRSRSYASAPTGSCFARLELTLEVYEGLRSDPQRYLTAPGHEIPAAMVIEQTGSFALAEKL
jgi:hypothetical protein